MADKPSKSKSQPSGPINQHKAMAMGQKPNTGGSNKSSGPTTRP